MCHCRDIQRIQAKELQRENNRECSCPQCISACRNDPGRLVPADLPVLASFLGISTGQLIAEYLVMIPLHGKNKIMALAPAKLKGRRFIAQPGTVVPPYYTAERGTCIFLDENGLCAVHAAKPFECGAYMGCKNTFLGKPYRDKQVEDYFLQKWKKFRME